MTHLYQIIGIRGQLKQVIAGGYDFDEIQKQAEQHRKSGYWQMVVIK